MIYHHHVNGGNYIPEFLREVCSCLWGVSWLYVRFGQFSPLLYPLSYAFLSQRCTASAMWLQNKKGEGDWERKRKKGNISWFNALELLQLKGNSLNYAGKYMKISMRAPAYPLPDARTLLFIIVSQNAFVHWQKKRLIYKYTIGLFDFYKYT